MPWRCLHADIGPGDAFYQYIHPDGELISVVLMQASLVGLKGEHRFCQLKLFVRHAMRVGNNGLGRSGL
jgi:hypothetical protein